MIFYNCKTSKHVSECDLPVSGEAINITNEYLWIKNHLPDAGCFIPEEYKELAVWNVYNNDKELIAYIAHTSENKISGEGYGGEIDLAVVFNTTHEIIGIEITNHCETKSFLKNVISKGYLDQFKGKNLNNTIKVDSISGATYTSKGILTGVNNLSSQLKGAPQTTTIVEPEKKK